MSECAIWRELYTCVMPTFTSATRCRRIEKHRTRCQTVHCANRWFAHMAFWWYDVWELFDCFFFFFWHIFSSLPLIHGVFRAFNTIHPPQRWPATGWSSLSLCPMPNYKQARFKMAPNFLDFLINLLPNGGPVCSLSTARFFSLDPNPLATSFGCFGDWSKGYIYWGSLNKIEM